MRETKFRVWNKDDNFMDYFDLRKDFDFDDYRQILPNYELMQYTGLKDKKCKEIYCSDFLDFNGLEYEVVFENGGWLAKCLTTGPNPDGTESKRPDEWLFDFHKLTEVIGNKYEN